MRKRQKKPGKREIRSISLKKQTEKNKKQKTGLTKEEKKRLKELRMIKAENQKKRKPFTAQDTIPYKEIYKDGICRTDDNYYSFVSIFITSCRIFRRSTPFKGSAMAPNTLKLFNTLASILSSLDFAFRRLSA